MTTLDDNPAPERRRRYGGYFGNPVGGTKRTFLVGATINNMGAAYLCNRLPQW